MQHKQGEERNQVFMFRLGSAIAPDSFVRVVDAFVDTVTWFYSYKCKGKRIREQEVGLAFMGYKLTRCISIHGVVRLIKRFRESCLAILKLKFRLVLWFVMSSFIRVKILRFAE